MVRNFFQSLFMLLLAFGVLWGGLPASAQIAYSVKIGEGQKLRIEGKDASRTDNALILYTPDFGPSTRTNPYGVEVIAEEIHKQPSHYRVIKVVSIWDCEKSDLSLCGNAHIPEDGLVISAAGDERQSLLQALPEGSEFELEKSWFQQTSFPLTIINPTPQTNPMASGFPGYRASNQLIIYNPAYGKPNTGTNEFGFEVTVQDGVVVAHEGADSAIPQNGYVISGHGRARDWLIANAPLGAKIQISDDGKQITSIIDLTTYQYQLKKQLDDAHDRLNWKQRRKTENVQQEIVDLQNKGKLNEAAQLAVESIEQVNRILWTTYSPFPQGTIQAVWDRPIEKNAHEVGRTLDMLKKAGFNTVFLETYFHGYPIYPSTVYQDYGLDNQNPNFVGWDPLKTWTEEAHKRGMKLQVWFQTFYSGTNAFHPPGPVLGKYPEWANVQYSALEKTAPTASSLELGSYFLDPANPEVQSFLLKVIDELVSRYPIDGFQLDYIRYPASFPPDRFSYLKTTWGYTVFARKEFQEQSGVDPATLTPERELWQKWAQYKTQKVTDFVQKATTLVHEKRKGILVSAAVFPKLEDSLVMKHQDWGTWIANGWLDFIAPMTLTSASKVVDEDTKRVLNRTNSKVPVVAGIFGPFNANSAEQVLEQLEAARGAGASGYSIFDTAHLTGRILQSLQVSHGQSDSK